MLACALLTVSLAVSECVTVHRHGKGPDIKATLIKELPPLFIKCNLTDIITISALTTNDNSIYYLYNPNNEVTQRKIHESIKEERTKYINGNNSVIQNTTYKVKNVNLGQKFDSKTKDVFDEKDNEFHIGPVGQEDHGNWVLSIYQKNNGSWAEMFQVITILIVEIVPVLPASPVLMEGDKLELSFAYPFQDIRACELSISADNPPFDRKYERYSLPNCTYVLENLTLFDTGTWTIIGTGYIVYEGRTSLTVNKNTREAFVSHASEETSYQREW